MLKASRAGADAEVLKKKGEGRENVRKYEITEETLTFDGHVLHRIKAVRDFGSIKAVDEGGWIEKEENLSHDGCAWVHKDACVFENALVSENASMYGEAKVLGDALVCGNARVGGNARVCGNARVYDDARIHGDARVFGDACVYGEAQVYGGSCVYGDAEVYGYAKVHGNALVSGDARVFGDANVYEKNHLMYVANIGSRYGATTFFQTKSGDIRSFEKAVKRTHHGTIHEKVYLKAIELAKLQIQGENEER